MSDAPIWILDEVTTKPGQGPAFLAAYMERYAPKAQARGMTALAHRMVEPAMWLDDAPNRLVLVWTLPNAGAVWGASMARGPIRMWRSGGTRRLPAFIESRRRSTLADADMLAEYDNV